jgi:cytochrome c556
MKPHTTGIAAIVAVSILAVAKFAIAEEEQDVPAESVIQHELITELQRNPREYRSAIKSAMQGHLSAAGLLIMMRAPDTDQLPLHADSLVWLTKTHESLYVEGSATPATRETIWTQPEDFEAAASKTTLLAQQLQAAIDGSNRHLTLNAIIELGESCESCHARFRSEED